MRNYYSLDFGGRGSTAVNLPVRTDSYADTRISYVTFHVRGKLVSGGACNVPSVFIQKYGIDKRLTFDTKSASTVAFVPFTEKELAKLATQYERGGIAALELMFEERN